MKNFSGLDFAGIKPVDRDAIVPGMKHLRHTQQVVRAADLLPSSMRMMLDLQRSFAQNAGLSSRHAIAGALGAGHPGGAMHELLGSFRHRNGIMSTLRTMGSVRAMIARQFPNVADFTHLRYVQGFAAKLDDIYPGLARDFGPKGALAWQAAVLGSLRGLEGVMPYLPSRVAPVGVVAMLSPSRAAFAWMTGDEETLTARAAALRPPRRPAREIKVRLKIDCARCGDPFVLFDLARTLEGDVLEVSAAAFPVCVRCVKETGGDLEQLVDEALAPKTPTLMVHPGERQGPPNARGQLRLVPRRDDSDDQ